MRFPLASLLLLSACTTAPGTPTGDDGSGSGSGPGDPGSATALVLRSGTPAEGVRVVFHDADGEVLDVVTTGADGTATGAMVTGGMITVPQVRSDGSKQLSTMTGVALDETITFGLPAADISGDDISMLRVSGSPVQNASNYTVDTGCRSSSVSSLSPAPEIAVGTACVGSSGSATVLVASRDASNTPYSWAAAVDVPVTPGQVAQASLSAWSADWNGLYVSTVDLPARSIGILGAAAAVHHDIPFRGLAVANQVVAYPDSSSSFFLGYPVFGEAVEYKLELYVGDDMTAAPTGESAIVGRIAGHAENLMLHGTDYLPSVSGIAATADARAQISWSPRTDGDAVLAIETGSAGRWSIMTPPDAGHVRVPALPAELADYAPSSPTIDVVVVDDDAITGFDELRGGTGLNILDRPLRGDSARVRYALERLAR